MKKKISITLSSEVLALVVELAGSKHARSDVIEQVLLRFLRQRASSVVELHDLELINGAADQLNIEAADVLEYASAFV